MDKKQCLTVKLPSIPAVAMRLLGMISDPDLPTAEIVNLVQTDPAITANILKAANSPVFGAGKSIDSLHRAVVWLGRQAVSCLALTFSLSEKAREGGALNGHYKDYWLRSVIHALAMEFLGKRGFLASSGGLFVAGLLMDLGRLALLQNQASDYSTLLDESRLPGRRLVDLEQARLGTTHPDVSAELLAAWSLPDAIVAVARNHELLPGQVLDQRGIEHFPQIAAANVAAATADFLCGVNPMESFQRLEFLTSKLYSFSQIEMREYLDGVKERLHASSGLLSADTSGMPSTTELLARAMEQLSVLSLQSIAQLQAVAGRATPSGDEIQELRMKLYELEKSSCRDALTGVYKRDYFEGRLTQRLRQSDGQPVTLGILFGDVDKFKRINDTCGHAAGDAVLIAVATVLQSCVRNTDVVARYGGDEFVILAESPDPTFLEKLAERIHQQLASTTVRAGTEEIRVAMSLGGAFISIVPNERQLAQPLRLVALADEAMYECKRRGGNAVTIKVHAADVQRPAASA